MKIMEINDETSILKFVYYKKTVKTFQCHPTTILSLHLMKEIEKPVQVKTVAKNKLDDTETFILFLYIQKNTKDLTLRFVIYFYH